MSIADGSELKQDTVKVSSRASRFAQHLYEHGLEEYEEPEGVINLSSPTSPRAGKMRGTCMDVEKSYLRLTSAPKPSTVRPLKVLKEALKLVKGNSDMFYFIFSLPSSFLSILIIAIMSPRCCSDSTPLPLIIERYIKDEEYAYVCDQLKSIRQDLTIQHINNKFTAHVYETHGRIALESGDLSEYNQCSSRLQEMKKRGIAICAAEFDCYRILYSLFQNNKLELIGVLRDLAKDNPGCLKRTRSESMVEEVHRRPFKSDVSFALEVVQAVQSKNPEKFFSLYHSAPDLSGYLLDFFVHSMRIAGKNTLLRSHLSISLEGFKRKLGFSNDKQGHQECVMFVKEHKIIVRKDIETQVNMVMCKESLNLPKPRTFEGAKLLPFTDNDINSNPGDKKTNNKKKNKKRHRTEDRGSIFSVTSDDHESKKVKKASKEKKGKLKGKLKVGKKEQKKLMKMAKKEVSLAERLNGAL